MTDATPEPEHPAKPKPKAKAEAEVSPPRTAPNSLAKTYAQLSGVDEAWAAVLAPIQAEFAASESLRKAFAASESLQAAFAGHEATQAALEASKSFEAVQRSALEASALHFDWDKIAPSVPALYRLAEGLRNFTVPVPPEVARLGAKGPVIPTQSHRGAVVQAQGPVVVEMGSRAAIADLLATSIAQGKATEDARRDEAAAATALRKSDIRRGWIMLAVGTLAGGLVTVLLDALAGHN